jgi:hypothetical protein
MSLRLGPVIEPEHRFHDSIQLLGELNNALAATVGAPRMLEALQFHAERGLQLCHGAGEQHSTTLRMFLYDTQTMTRRECLDGGNVCGLRSVAARELFTRQVPDRAVAAG